MAIRLGFSQPKARIKVLGYANKAILIRLSDAWEF